MKRPEKIKVLFLFLAVTLCLTGCQTSDIKPEGNSQISSDLKTGTWEKDTSQTTEEGVSEEMKTTDVTIDFSKREGVPLLKKFGLFNSGIVGLDQYTRDGHLMDGLRTDSLRVDIYMGEDGRPFARVVDGTEAALTYHFEDLDALVKLLDEHGVRPYWSWSYIPIPLQVDGNWRKGPSNLDQWQNMFRELAAHYKNSGLRIAYHEVYNEPDCGDVFFLGTMADYTEMYIRAAKGLKEGDPDAVIGGPSSAFVEVTGQAAMNAFLDRVLEENVPLDFFTYHSYGYDKNQYINRTHYARSILSQYEEFDTTELHLNEYNTLIQPFEANGPAEHAIGGATMLTSFEQLLDETDVTLAHWAQFLDTGYEPLGMVDPQGRIKAPYWAYWMYSQMPEQRVSVTGLQNDEELGVHTVASSDETGAYILVWNDSETDQLAQIKLLNNPISTGECQIYSISDENDPYWNTNDTIELAPQMVTKVEELGDTLTVELPSGGFTLYRMGNNGEMTGGESSESVGTMIRKRYYFPERGKSSYAFFDEIDQTAYLGMNGEYSARAIVAQERENLPDVAELDCVFGGTYEEVDLNTSFSVRVDYNVDGVYTKAVLYTFMPVNPRRDSTVPWGTQQEADEVIQSDTLLTGNTWLMLKDNAPEGWSGRAIITYDMHSTGNDTWVEMRLSEKS